VTFEVTAADCRRDTFRCGGKGGQNLQKRDTGVRFTHLASGAVGESCDERNQAQNVKTAWTRMAKSPVFRAWAAQELLAREEGHRSLERKIDSLLEERNLKVELGVAPRPGDVIVE
jgi:protein subunit release factor B